MKKQILFKKNPHNNPLGRGVKKIITVVSRLLSICLLVGQFKEKVKDKFQEVEVGIANFLLRTAVESDGLKIRDLIHRVGINPMDLNWKHFIVAETPEGQFIGCAQLKQHGDKSVELASLAVEAEFRGQGVARSLIEQLLTQSPRPLYLMCRHELGVFYEPFGFSVIGVNEMPPYFRRMLNVIKIMVFLTRHEGPLIMRLD